MTFCAAALTALDRHFGDARGRRLQDVDLYARSARSRRAGFHASRQLWRRRLCRIWRATAIQPSGDLTQEWVSVRSARGLWRGR